MIRHLLIQIIIFPLFIYSQTDSVLSGFRNSPFGSSPNEVMSRETAPSLQSFSGWGIYALSFEGKFVGRDARIDYTFVDNKLIEGSYILDPEDDYLNTFLDCREIISKVYGKPNKWAVTEIDQDVIWHKLSNLGLYEGPQLFWLFNKGFIVLHSSKFKNKITVTVLFSSRNDISDYNAKSLLDIKNP
jgi:hypothetical protein